jgi:hypothetical protein
LVLLAVNFSDIRDFSVDQETVFVCIELSDQGLEGGILKRLLYAHAGHNRRAADQKDRH